MITLTDKARQMVEEISNSEGLGHYSVRVLVRGGHCAGLKYDMYFDDNPKDTDEVFDFDGVKIIVDMISILYIDGCEIDFQDSELNSGFKFNNITKSTSCGCGSSWSP